MPILSPEVVEVAETIQKLDFKCYTHSNEACIAIEYALPDSSLSVQNTELFILRRERRFPGLFRRGNLPVEASNEELNDGLPVFDSSMVNYDFEESWEEHDDEKLIVSLHQYRYIGTPRDRQLVRRIRKQFNRNEATPEKVSITIFDREELVSGRIYYYTAFLGPKWFFSRATQSSALAIINDRFKLFQTLPLVHQQEDTSYPDPKSVHGSDVNRGQLERFMDVFSQKANMLATEVDALKKIRDMQSVDSRLLSRTANLLGWKLFTDVNEDFQRSEIEFSPHAYRTTGASLNLAAIVNRLIGWDAEVKEFSAHIVNSFDETRVENIDGSNTIYLDGHVQVLDVAPYLNANQWPIGSVDTNDLDAMYAIRTRSFEDKAAYTYDCGRAEDDGQYARDNDVWFNRETIGVYIVPDVETESFSPEQFSNVWERIRKILADFIPINTRLVFILLPGTIVEEVYDATQDVVEELTDLGIENKAEVLSGMTEDKTDIIPQWNWLIANNTDQGSVDTDAESIYTWDRTWHVGLDQSH